MWHLGMLGLAALVAALLTPVAWLLVRLSGLLPYLVQATQLRLFPLHLLAGLCGCGLGPDASPGCLHRYGRARRPEPGDGCRARWGRRVYFLLALFSAGGPFLKAGVAWQPRVNHAGWTVTRRKSHAS